MTTEKDSHADSWFGRTAHRLLFGVVSRCPPRVRDAALRRIFDSTHNSGEDPWSVDSDSYEVFKRQQLIAAVPASAGTVLELGCSIGANLRDLAEAHPDATIVGCDVSPRAIDAARRVTDGLANVRLSVTPAAADIPGTVPSGMDVLVLSEVLYYMGGAAGIERTLGPVSGSLQGGGTVVMVHSADDAPALHDTAVRVLGLRVDESRWYAPPGDARSFLLTRAHRPA
ncbi:MAG: class I SAM-dependent methyltransferase [bacterium]